MTVTVDEPLVEAAVDEAKPVRAPRFESFDALSLGLAWISLAAGLVFATGLADPLFDPLGRLMGASVLGMASVILSRSLRLVNEDAGGAWSILSTAVAAVAMAAFVVTLRGVEPFPSLPDLFLAAFVVLSLVGLYRLPHHSPSRFAAARVALDVLAGTVAFGALAWDVAFDGQPEAGLAVLVRPTLGVVLIAAVILVSIRRGPNRGDRRIAAYVAGASLTAFAMAFEPLLSVRPSTDVALRLGAAAAFAYLAWAIRQLVATGGPEVARMPFWRLAVPYSLVGLLFSVFFWRAVGGDGSLSGVVPWGVVLVLAILVARQAAATTENRELVEAERDQLIASLSHELRTPLTAVTGFADVIWDQWGNLTQRDARDMMDIIRTQSHHLSGLVTDIVALVRDELDSVRLQLERIDARELVGEAIKSVFDLNGGVVPVTAQVEPITELIGDRARLHQVMVAMLKNAQRYGSGEILIVVRRTKDGRLIEVHDDGDGLPPRHEDVVWDRFQRGSHQLNSNVPGSGLGLTTIRSIARAHGGKARYRRSDKLGGACFSVEIPYDKVKDLVDSDA